MIADRFLRAGFFLDVDDREARIIHRGAFTLLFRTTSSST